MWVAVAAVVGGVATYAAASASASGAEDAAQTQADAANNSTALQKYMYDTNRSDLAPYRSIGTTGLYNLANLMGITTDVTSQVGPAPVAPNRSDFDNQGSGLSWVNSLPINSSGLSWANSEDSNSGQYGWVRAEGDAGDANGGYIRVKIGGNGSGFDQAGYDAAMAKYNQDLAAYNAKIAAAQQAQTSNPTFGSLMQPFDATKFKQDPGYQFRLSEALRGVQNSSAAKGGFFSGNTGAALTQLSQNMASDEYNNAYNRYNLDQTNEFNRLASMAGIGQQATNTTAQLGANYANNASNTMMTAANNIGNAYQNAASARASGYQGIGNQIMAGVGQYNQNQMINSLMNNMAWNQYSPSAYTNAADTIGSEIGMM